MLEMQNKALKLWDRVSMLRLSNGDWIEYQPKDKNIVNSTSIQECLAILREFEYNSKEKSNSDTHIISKSIWIKC